MFVAEQFHASPKCRRFLASIVAAGCFALVVEVCLLAFGSDPDVLAHPIIWTLMFAILLACILAIQSVLAAVSANPLISFDNEGITERSSVFAQARILWHEIADVRLSKDRFWLLIDLKDSAEFLSRQTPYARFDLWMNLKTCGAPVVIPRFVLSLELSELRNLLLAALNDPTRPRSAPTRNWYVDRSALD